MTSAHPLLMTWTEHPVSWCCKPQGTPLSNRSPTPCLERKIYIFVASRGLAFPDARPEIGVSADDANARDGRFGICPVAQR